MSKDFDKLIIKTGIKFFGQKIYIASTNNVVVDEAMKRLFKDDYMKTAPLSMSRWEVKVLQKAGYL